MNLDPIPYLKKYLEESEPVSWWVEHVPGCPEPAQPGPHAAVGGGNLLPRPQQQSGQVGIWRVGPKN
jgi:hypothetical protein